MYFTKVNISRTSIKILPPLVRPKARAIPLKEQQPHGGAIRFNRIAPLIVTSENHGISGKSVNMPRPLPTLPSLSTSPQASPKSSSKKQIKTSRHQECYKDFGDCVPQASPEISSKKLRKTRRTHKECRVSKDHRVCTDAFLDCLRGVCECSFMHQPSPTYKSLKEHLVQRWGQDVFKKRRDEVVDYMFSINTTLLPVQQDASCYSPKRATSPQNIRACSAYKKYRKIVSPKISDNRRKTMPIGEVAEDQTTSQSHCTTTQSHAGEENIYTLYVCVIMYISYSSHSLSNIYVVNQPTNQPICIPQQHGIKRRISRTWTRW